MKRSLDWGRLGALGAGLLLLASCAERYLPVDEAGRKTATAPASTPLAPPPAEKQATTPAQTPSTPVTPGPVTPGPVTPGPVTSGPSVPQAPSEPPPIARPVAADQCGSKDLQFLVGRPKSQIPVPVDLTRRQVTCTTCVMSHDADPRRVTILFDQSSGLVTQVLCR